MSLVGKTIKASAETKRVIIDFADWLDAAETVDDITTPVVGLQAEAWVGPWPPPIIVDQVPVIPDDATPLVCSSSQIVTPAGRYVYLFLDDGTVGNSYSVTFVATGSSSGRTKEVRVDVSVVASGGRVV